MTSKITIAGDFTPYDPAHRYDTSGATLTYNGQTITVPATELYDFIEELANATEHDGRLGQIAHGNRAATMALASAASARLREAKDAEDAAIEAAKAQENAERAAREEQRRRERDAEHQAAQAAATMAANNRRRQFADEYAAIVAELSSRD